MNRRQKERERERKRTRREFNAGLHQQTENTFNAGDCIDIKVSKYMYMKIYFKKCTCI